MKKIAIIAFISIFVFACKDSKKTPVTTDATSEVVLVPFSDSVKAAIDSLVKQTATQHQCRITVKIAGDSTAAYYSGYDGRAGQSISDFSGSIDIGSCSKMFTATSILQLVEQNKLSLQDKLTTVLPNDTLYKGLLVLDGKDYIDSVKIIDLLHHSSGFPDYFIEGDDDKEITLHGDSSLRFTPQGLISLAKQTNKPQFIPGTTFKYCNVNYILLGLIIEKITGESWQQYVQKNILDKLELKQTYFASLQSPPNRAPGHFKGKMSVMPATMAGAAGEIISTLDDMQSFISGWNKGKLFSNPAFIETVRSENFITMSGPIKYGMGVIDLMRLSFGHAGQTFGFQSYQGVLTNGHSFSLGIDDAAVSAWEPAIFISQQLSKQQ